MSLSRDLKDYATGDKSLEEVKKLEKKAIANTPANKAKKEKRLPFQGTFGEIDSKLIKDIIDDKEMFYKKPGD